MRKKRILMLLGSVCLALMLALPLVAACAAPTPTKVIEWRWTTHLAPTDPAQVKIAEMWDRIESKSEGRFKVTKHYGVELGYKAKEYLNILSRNLVESATCAMSVIAYDEPWLGVGSIPFLTRNSPERYVAIDAMATSVEEFCAENDIVCLFHFNLISGAVYGFTNEYIQNLDDLKGLKIRTWNPEQQVFWTELGASPLFVDFSEIYLALQRGTCDVVTTGGSAGLSMNLQEVAKYAVFFWPNLSYDILGVSKIAWDELPEDIQSIILEESAALDTEIRALLMDPGYLDMERKDQIEAAGLTVVDLPQEMVEAMVPAAEASQEAWLEKAGPEGQRILDAVNRALAGYRQ